MSTHDTTANPAPLGLLGFGMTTVLLNIHNTGLVPLSSAIVSLGIFVGGIAQVLAGLQEWRKGNTFGATAFTAYGFFWLALVALWTLPRLGMATPTDELSMGFFLALWGLFTLGMWAATFSLNRLLQIVFGTLTLLFTMLAVRDFLNAITAGAGTVVGLGAGYVGIFCGLAAIYGALAQVINEVLGKAVLPLGRVQKDQE